MSTATARSPIDQAIFDRNAELFQGYVLEQLDDPHRMEQIPAGTTLILLPQGDPAGIEAALAMAADLARRGDNVYRRHADPDGRPR